jgi:hypothetical protein
MRTNIVPISLLALIVACEPEPDPNDGVETPDEARARFESEAQQHGAMGSPASFSFDGNEFKVTPVNASVSLSAPMTLRLAEIFSGGTHVYFENANVTGVGEGTLILEGDALNITSGTLANASIAVADANATEVSIGIANEIEGGEITLPEEWAVAQSGYFFSNLFSAQVDALTVSGYARGVLITADAAVDVGAEVTVTSSRIRMSEESRVILTSELRIPFESVAMGGDVTSGSLNVEGQAAIDAPQAVFGLSGAVKLSPGHLESDGDVRVTQAIRGEELMIGSEVEFVPATNEVSVVKNQSEFVKVYFREKSYVGDAILGDVQVEGIGEGAVELLVAPPPTFVGVWVDAVSSAGWAGGIAAAATAPAVLGLVFVDLTVAIVCTFGECPEQYPYPSWMQAGQVGQFFFKVNGVVEAGTYDVVLHVTGKNYETVDIPITINVTE